MDTETRFDRLPKWAKKEIETLRRTVGQLESDKTALKNEVNDALNGVDGSTGVKVESGAVFDDPINIDPRSTVTFNLDDKNYLAVRMREREPGKVVVELHGSTMIHLQPVSSNVTYVRVIDTRHLP